MVHFFPDGFWSKSETFFLAVHAEKDDDHAYCRLEDDCSQTYTYVYNATEHPDSMRCSMYIHAMQTTASC